MKTKLKCEACDQKKAVNQNGLCASCQKMATKAIGTPPYADRKNPPPTGEWWWDRQAKCWKRV